MITLYTIGTWRVARKSYLNQFKALGVGLLVDVRGNPRAGRQEELKRGRDFENALWASGVAYEYWGNALGEDAFEEDVNDSLLKVLGQLAVQAKSKTVCLLGHLHEPQGCHRLKLCDLLLAETHVKNMQIIHLLWEDHERVKQLSHASVAAEAAEVLRFFEENKARAEAVRKERHVPDPAEQLIKVPWNKFDSAHFTDGKAYHFLLPFHTDLYWYPHWLSQKEAADLEGIVHERVTFQHPTYMFQDPNGGFAKTLIKRGQVRICGDDCPGAVAATPLEKWSNDLLRRVEDSAGVAFNCFVANHYANGQVVINWHSDSGPGDDEGLGPNPHIGSLSLGAPRTFSLKSKRPVGGRMAHLDIPLTHGSLLVMGTNSQTHWLHALVKDDTCNSERINLTFRFYARQSTKHIEGMEHNHEWEAAAGSTRVLLHRDGFGRPVLVDLPDDLQARQMSRYVSTVLPGFRGNTSVFVKGCEQKWRKLEAAELVVKASHSGNNEMTPEVSIVRENAGKDRSDEVRGGKSVAGKGKLRENEDVKGTKGKGTSTGTAWGKGSNRWNRAHGRGGRA